jgi:shikimate kinase
MGPARAARPLLAGAEPRAALEGLLQRREALYAMADHVLDTEALSVAEVADTLVAITRELERADA